MMSKFLLLKSYKVQKQCTEKRSIEEVVLINQMKMGLDSINKKLDLIIENLQINEHR